MINHPYLTHVYFNESWLYTKNQSTVFLSSHQASVYSSPWTSRKLFRSFSKSFLNTLTNAKTQVKEDSIVTFKVRWLFQITSTNGFIVFKRREATLKELIPPREWQRALPALPLAWRLWEFRRCGPHYWVISDSQAVLAFWTVKRISLNLILGCLFLISKFLWLSPFQYMCVLCVVL